VLRVIARLNIGGPAIQAITLTQLLQARGYVTTLVRGSEEPDEGSMGYLAEQLAVKPLHVPCLRRNPGAHDLLALLRLMRIVARERPQIVHTHAAKAGTLGRVAALLAPGRDRRVLVHTFHGHSLSGYFSSRTARLYCAIERFLARRTDRLIAVSDEVRDELVAMGVAPAERFDVIRLGFDLSPFTVDEPERSRRGASLRAELGIARQAPLVTLIARLVPIKRVDRFLRAAVCLTEANSADARGSGSRSKGDICFLIVGDGELRERLQASEEARALGNRLIWAGFRRDIPDVCFASEVVILTSDNEGTPVSLIEALAAGTPVVSTDVGGVSTVVRHEQTGLLAPPRDEHTLADAVGRVLDDIELADRMSSVGRSYVLSAFAQDRLVGDIDDLYRKLLAR
jgi:glycosyltransferase involved in cell wall biosynthesis